MGRGEREKEPEDEAHAGGELEKKLEYGLPLVRWECGCGRGLESETET